MKLAKKFTKPTKRVMKYLLEHSDNSVVMVTQGILASECDLSRMGVLNIINKLINEDFISSSVRGVYKIEASKEKLQEVGL